jgi:hypothetical protein
MINVNIDTFLKIGNTHKICEDYIISGVDPIPHIILADGCSSSKNTEMGARLLCYLARQFLTLKDIKNSTHDQIGSWIINNAEMTARQLGLNASALDSTLIISYYDKDLDAIITHFYGDGFLITIDKLNQMTVYEVKFTKNAPYYLSYKLDQARENAYHELKTEMQYTCTAFSRDDVPYTRLAYDYSLTIIKAADLHEVIMICSDGVDSFYDKNDQDFMDYLAEFARQVTHFKNTAGSFLKRRASKAIQYNEKRDIFHADDLSIGAYLIQEEEECSTTSTEEK